MSKTTFAEIEEALDAARLNLFAGQVSDERAVNKAVELGLVERYYQGGAGFMGLARLRLTGKQP